MEVRCLVGVVLVLAAGSARGHEVTLPDVIIGDPNEHNNDILGPPISSEEMEMALRYLDEDDVLNDDEDPITSSSSRFFEGDISLGSRHQLDQILKGDPERQMSAINNADLIWANGVVPYVVSQAFSKKERYIIGRAMKDLATSTCLSFVARTSSHDDYIHIFKDEGCYSRVGRAGGQQKLSLGRGCVYKGVVLHELMHAAGFWHEQSRSDRDDYVNIAWDNIIDGRAFNFLKKTDVTMDLGLPYNYGSIMHYGPYAFARSYNKPTITPKQSGVGIGQRKGLSKLDIQGLNLLYHCSSVELTTLEPTTPRPTIPEPTPLAPVGAECHDSNNECSYWAMAGYCRKTPVAKLYCKKSCRLCECKDRMQQCARWARKGRCKMMLLFMTILCPRACGFCPSSSPQTPKRCKDLNWLCPNLAARGNCLLNRRYMTSHCPRSCQVC